MSPRPDYVPSAWTQGPINRWIQKDPRRVVAWFIAAPTVIVLLAAILLVGGSWLGWVAAVTAVPLLLQAFVYVPRALKASRWRGP